MPQLTNLTEQQARELFGTDFTGVHRNPEGTFTADETAVSRLAPTRGTGIAPAAAPNYLEQFLSENRQFQEGLRIQLETSLASIREQGAAARAAQQEAGRRASAQLGTSLIRTGGRYTPQLTTGFLTAQETANQQALAEIDVKINSAIAQAQEAFNRQNYSVMEQRFTLLEKLEEQQRQVLEKQQEETKKQNEKIAEEKLKRDKDSFIYTVIQTGITDPLKIFDQLKDKETTITSDDIKKFFDNLMPKEKEPEKEDKNDFKFTSEQMGKLLASSSAEFPVVSGEDVQTLQDTMNKYGLYSKIAELGNKSLAEFLPAQQFKTIKEILYPPLKKDKASEKFEGDSSKLSQSIRLARMVFGSGRALSDQDRDFAFELYNKGVAEGKDIYKMADEVSGFFVVKNKPLAEGLRTVILNISGEKGMFDYDMEGLARLLNAGQEMAAVRKVENAALIEAKKLTGEVDFVSEDDVVYINDKMNEITKLLGEGWIDEVGAFTGTFSKFISRKFGLGQAVKIKAKITSLTSNLINKRAGSALTDTEWKRLVADNIPAMNESGKAVRQKLQELFDDPLTRLNAIREIVSLPSLTADHIRIPETRIKLYISGTVRELDDFLGLFEATGAGGTYQPSIWQNIK